MWSVLFNARGTFSDMLRKKVGPNRKLSVPGSHMDSIGEIGTRLVSGYITPWTVSLFGN